MLHDKSHAFPIRVKRELSHDFVFFHLSCVLVLDSHELLGALVKDQTHLLGTLDESQLIWTRGLVQDFICLWALIDNYCVANCKKAEEVKKSPSFVVLERLSPILIKCFGDLALDHLHRTFDHASVVIDPIVNVLVRQVPVNLISNLTLLELHLVLRECASFVGENEFHLTQFLNQITIAAKCEIGIARVRKDHLHIPID